MILSTRLPANYARMLQRCHVTKPVFFEAEPLYLFLSFASRAVSLQQLASALLVLVDVDVISKYY